MTLKYLRWSKQADTVGVFQSNHERKMSIATTP